MKGDRPMYNDFNNYNVNPYNPYMQQRALLKGRVVSNIEEARSALIDMDGSITFFPCLSENCIYTKAIDLNAPNPIKINSNCVYCGLCVEKCQFDAIRVYGDYFYSEEGDLYYARSYISGPREGDYSLSHDKCQACGICTNNCPTGALTLEDDKISWDEDKCLLCRECEFICPVDAIRIKIR